MCTSYEANPNDARWDVFNLFPRPDFEYKPEIYKDYYAPIFLRGGEQLTTVPASFGIVPRRHIPPGVKVFDTMNARSESVEQKRTSAAHGRACSSAYPMHVVLRAELRDRQGGALEDRNGEW